MSLADVMQHAQVWKGSWRGGDDSSVATVASGFSDLDTKLPGGGFPLGALTEVLAPRSGIGELSLVLRAAANVTRERWLALIAPPHIPYAPALVRAGIDLSHVLVVHARQYTDTLWAVEQALRAGTCGAVLAWPSQADFKWLRRLQLAAETSEALTVLFTSSRYVATTSPAALRLALEPRPDGLGVRIVKCRGNVPVAPVRLEVAHLRGKHVVAMSRSSVSAARNLHAR